MLRAGLWSRIMAHNIDLTILLPVFYLLGSVIESNTYLWVTCGVISVIYDAGFSMSPWMGTPGKKVMKLKVLKDSGEPLSYDQAFWRTLAKALTLLTLFIGYLMIAFTPQRKGLHDYLAGTAVFFQIDA